MPASEVESHLVVVPSGLRRTLVDEFKKLQSAYQSGNWLEAEVRAGKFAEAAYWVAHGIATGAFPAKASKPANMVAACQSLSAQSSAPRSIRIQVPRVLIAIYELRNNRGASHTGSEVDPGEMDAKLCLDMAKWVLAEIIRILGGPPNSQLVHVISALSKPTTGLVWSEGEVTRVLDQRMAKTDQVLVLLVAADSRVSEDRLRDNVEHPDASAFRRDVLKPLHRKRLIEYRRKEGDAILTPKGTVQATRLIGQGT